MEDDIFGSCKIWKITQFFKKTGLVVKNLFPKLFHLLHVVYSIMSFKIEGLVCIFPIAKMVKVTF